MNKYLIPVILCLLAAAAPIFGQTAEPRYVDIDEARAEISRLQQDNQAMSQVNDTLASENSELDSQISGSREFIVQIEQMIDRIISAKGPIYTALQNVVESDTRSELQGKMEELRESEYQLQKTKRQEYETINQANDLVETNRRMIAVNNVRSNTNEQRIVFLDACIAYTLNENRDLDSLVNEVDQVNRDVELLLSRQ